MSWSIVRTGLLLTAIASLLTTPQPPNVSLSSPTHFTYSKGDVNYFLEIALGAEFSKDKALVVRRWSGDIRVEILGTPTEEDRKTVLEVIRELNELTQGSIRLQLSSDRPNIRIHFAKISQFSQVEPRYKPGNFGYAWVEWNEANVINSAVVLIATEKVTQKERSHLIREELTQSLGLLQDSFRYPDSVFYQSWTSVTEYSAIDRQLIRLLYKSRIKPGMTKEEVQGALEFLALLKIQAKRRQNALRQQIKGLEGRQDV